MTLLSIIIPTRNRSTFLRELLDSLLEACVGVESLAELIVVDNGSSDNTKQVVDAFSLKAPFSISYRYEPCPGLHVGRNLGAQIAKGEILAYLDDDVIVQKGWAKSIIDRFASDEKIAIVGGPCRPLWGVEEIPAWIEDFRYKAYDGWAIYALSLIDLGEKPLQVKGGYVFGCNFSIRRSVVLAQGGFHPDGMPLELLHYRGDGESAMSVSAASLRGMKVYYEPLAVVLHRIPQERLTREYILSIAKRNGIGAAYVRFRASYGKGMRGHIGELLTLWKELASACRNKGEEACVLCPTPAEYAYVSAVDSFKQYLRICFSSSLSGWVTQKSYFKESPCPYWPTNRSLLREILRRILRMPKSVRNIILKNKSNINELVKILKAKYRKEDGSKKIALFLVNWPLQSHTVNLVSMLSADGFNIDLFLYKACDFDFVDIRRLEADTKVKIYDLSHVKSSDVLGSRCKRLLRGDYAYFIGIEKEGLILAGELAEELSIPLVYQSMELYVEDHPHYTAWHLREPEKKYHRKAVATIIQDKRRAHVLCESNGVDMGNTTILYMPISVPGPKNTKRGEYFHDKCRMSEGKKILLYFGMIAKTRYCFELAKESRCLPEEMIIAFHGFFPREVDRAEFEAYANDRLILSTEMIPPEEIPNLISSVTIGLVFYLKDSSNDQLTAFSSEKVAYFMQSGIPIISFKNESFDELYAHYRCGEGIDSFSDIDRVARKILINYDEYRNNAFRAFEEYYSFENNYISIRSFFVGRNENGICHDIT